jgi:hypothetical protein
VATVYRVMRGDGFDLIAAPSQDEDFPIVGVASTLSLGQPLSYQGRFSNDLVVRFKQKALHAIAFGSKYMSPCLHCTKSWAVTVQKYLVVEANAYLVKIDVVGLSGAQPGIRRASADSGSQPGSGSGSQPGSGWQPASLPAGCPVVIDRSTLQAQQAGEGKR